LETNSERSSWNESESADNNINNLADNQWSGLHVGETHQKSKGKELINKLHEERAHALYLEIWV
jgi:hypothetical protein